MWMSRVEVWVEIGYVYVDWAKEVSIKVEIG